MDTQKQPSSLVSPLKIATFSTPLSWLDSQHFQSVLSRNEKLLDLEMLIVSNGDSERNMNLGMRDVKFCIESFPCLTVLGNLKSWALIDYYDPNSQFYFKSESEFCRFKRDCEKRNFDLELQLENINFVYENL